MSAAVPVEAASPRRLHQLVPALERYSLVVLLVVLVGFFALLPRTADAFLTTANLQNILANQGVIAIAALAALIPLVCQQFDVSVGAVLGMSSIVIADLTAKKGVEPLVAIAIAVALTSLVGATAGAVVSYLGANSFIITLGMATLVGGLVSLYSNDQTIVGVPQGLTDAGNAIFLGIPVPAWVLLVVAVVVARFLRYSVTGREMVTIGASARAARLVGIPVARRVLLAFALAGLLAGIAGALQLSRTGAANPQIGPGLTLNALAAVFLGSTTIRPGQFNVPGTIVGVFLVAVSVNGLTLAGAAAWVDPVFNGAAVVIAVGASTLLVNRRRGQAA